MEFTATLEVKLLEDTKIVAVNQDATATAWKYVKLTAAKSVWSSWPPVAKIGTNSQLMTHYMLWIFALLSTGFLLCTGVWCGLWYVAYDGSHHTWVILHLSLNVHLSPCDYFWGNEGRSVKVNQSNFPFWLSLLAFFPFSKWCFAPPQSPSSLTFSLIKP